MKLIALVMRYSKTMTIVAVFVGLAAGIFNAALLALINNALSKTAPERQDLISAFIAVALLMLVSRVTSAVTLARLGQNVSRHLRLKMVRQILGAPLRHLENVGAARLLTALTDDIPNLAMGLIQAPLICMNLAVVIGCLIYLAWLSWQIFLGVLVFLAIGLLSYQLPLARANNYFRQVRNQFDALLRHFRSVTEGAKELKLHRKRQDDFFSHVLEPTVARLRENANTGSMIFSFASGWGQLLIFALVGSLIFFVPKWMRIDASVLTGFVIVTLYMMTPLEVLVNIMPIIARAQIAVQSVERLGLSLQDQTKETDKSDVSEGRLAWNSLELVGVTHTYHLERDGGSFTLGPVELTFRPGELVFLVGGNGSGKTTLAKLLLGLYAPESGEICLDKQPITDQNRVAYRQYFSAVFSDFYLFDSLLGIDTPKIDAKAQEYLKQFHLDHKVQVTNGQLSTVELSQGQRKRLALLTAYLEDRPFYLFDEWAADQDPTFKAVFYTQLLPELKARGKTILVITHDDHYYSYADRLIKLDYGQVEYDTATGIFPEGVWAKAPAIGKGQSLETAN